MWSKGEAKMQRGQVEWSISAQLCQTTQLLQGEACHGVDFARE